MSTAGGRKVWRRVVVAGVVLASAVGSGAALSVAPASARDSLSYSGFVESVDPVSGNVTGWARQGTRQVTLRVVVDGQDARLEVPSDWRSDVGSFGFTSGLPPRYLDGQPHTLQVFAQEFADVYGPRVPIPFLDGSTSRVFSIVDRSPVGFVDGAVGGLGQGWCQDPDTPSVPCTVGWSITYGDPTVEGGEPGPPETGGTAVADRPRVDGMPGYEIPIPEEYRTGDYYLEVSGNDTAGNENVWATLPNSGTGALVTRITP